MGLFKSNEHVTKEFHDASFYGDLKKVTKLLSRKEEIDVKALDEKYTLYNAVSSRFTEIS